MGDDGRRGDAPQVVHETTVIEGGRGGGGGGGLIALVILVIVLGVAAFLYFNGYLGRAADKADINVNVAAPKIDLPDINVTTSSPPPANSGK